MQVCHLMQRKNTIDIVQTSDADEDQIDEDGPQFQLVDVWKNKTKHYGLFGSLGRNRRKDIKCIS